MIRILTVMMAVCAMHIIDARADEPNTPTPWIAVSEHRTCIFKMIPADWPYDGKEKPAKRPTVGIAYVLDKNGELQELWRMEGSYHYEAYISNDESLPRWSWSVWGDDTEKYSDQAIAFYDRGKLLKDYRVNELIKDVTKLEHSVSHYSWRPEKQTQPTSFGPFWKQTSFHLVMVDKTAYNFETATGKITAVAVDKGAMSQFEIFEAEGVAENERGKKLLSESSFREEFEQTFTVEDVSASNGSIYGMHFGGAHWSADLKPKIPLAHPCEVNVVFPIRLEKIDCSPKAPEILQVLQKCLAHPAVRKRLEQQGAKGLRLRVAGDRLHWSTDDLQELLSKRKLAPAQETELKSWAGFIIDVKAHEFASGFLNVATGQLIWEDPISDNPFGLPSTDGRESDPTYALGPLPDRREIHGLHVERLHAFRLRHDGQRAAIGFFAGGFGFDPDGISAEGGEAGQAGFLALMAEDVDELRARTLVGVDRHPVADVAHAVLAEELHRVVAEALVQGGQIAFRCGVGAQLEHALAFARAGLDRAGIIRGAEENGVRLLLRDLAIRLAGLGGGLPVGIGLEGFPGGGGGVTALVRDDVDQGVVRALAGLDRHPVADVFHAMLLEQLAGVIAEAGQQVGQLAVVGDVGAQFEETAVFRVGGQNQEGKAGEQAEDEFHKGSAMRVQATTGRA